MRELGQKSVSGPRQTLEGRIKTLYYDESCALVEREDGPSVKVVLTTQDFETVRQEPERSETIRFYGRPRWRLGTEALDYREFDAEAVQLER